jgi:hypothetical protein
VPGGIDSESDLRIGADDGPDILDGPADAASDTTSATLADHVPFRRPIAGQRLTDEQLERDIE